MVTFPLPSNFFDGAGGITDGKLVEALNALFTTIQALTGGTLILQSQPGAASVGSTTWAATSAGDVAIPEAGDWLVVFTGEGFRSAGGGSPVDRQSEIGLSIDGAVPAGDNVRGFTPGDGGTTDKLTPIVANVITFTAGQTVGSRLRKALGSDVVTVSMSRRVLFLLKM